MNDQTEKVTGKEPITLLSLHLLQRFLYFDTYINVDNNRVKKNLKLFIVDWVSKHGN